MGLLSRIAAAAAARRKPTSLISATISRGVNEWSVTWEGDGPLPGTMSTQTLTAAADQAAAAVLAMHATQPLQPGAELQLVIYPWQTFEDAPIFDIDAGPDGFTATDMFGASSATLQGQTLDDLVAAAGNLNDPRAAGSMFYWTRPVTSLGGGSAAS